MVTLSIDAGRKSKVRAGDILGALTGEGGIAGADVGKIQISEQYSYVAVKRQVASAAPQAAAGRQDQGRSYRAQAGLRFTTQAPVRRLFHIYPCP